MSPCCWATAKGFQAAQNFAAGTILNPLRGDFNGDGKLDLAVANEGSGDVSVLLATAMARSDSSTIATE